MKTACREGGIEGGASVSARAGARQHASESNFDCKKKKQKQQKQKKQKIEIGQPFFGPTFGPAL